METLSSIVRLLDDHAGAIVAIFAAALSVATFLLWRATRDLYKSAISQIEAAKDAARAARTTAEHARTAERAYVKLSHASPGLKAESTGLFSVNMQAKNTGRTPANITEMRVKPVLLSNGESLPSRPNYERQGSQTRKAFLVADMAVYFGDTFSVTPAQAEQINDGTLKLYLIGYVDYIDAFGQHHRGGYARLYDPQPGLSNNLAFVTEGGYNYDRLRRLGEGNDWRSAQRG